LDKPDEYEKVSYSLDFVSILWYSLLKTTAELSKVCKVQVSRRWVQPGGFGMELQESSDHGIAFAI
jgi:hypothetical protein